MRDIGRILRECRLARGLEIDDIARKTFIRSGYLSAMEEGKFHRIPSVFDKGYLRIYANLLEMDSNTLLALYEQKKNLASRPQSVETTGA